jgi:4'-phosphopantetheinyl transferase
MLQEVYRKLDEFLARIPQQQHDTDVNSPKLYVFWALVTPQLITYLSDDFNLADALRIFTLSEQVKLRKRPIHNIAKQLLSKLLVKVVINYFRGAPIDENVPFKYEKYGKPFLDETTIQFSISTSNEIVCVAIATGSGTPIGVDLSHSEQDSISPVDFMSQFDPMFSELEKTQLMGIDDMEQRYIAFNQLWTLKEAFTKLVGSGLNLDLASFSFEMNLVQKLNSNPRWVTSLVDISSIADSDFLQKLLLQEFKCYSTMLDFSASLPIILSFVGQVNVVPPDLLYLDIGEILSN